MITNDFLSPYTENETNKLFLDADDPESHEAKTPRLSFDYR